VQDADQEQHQSAPNNYDQVLNVLSGDRSVARDAWSAIEELGPPAEHENADKHEDDQGEDECDARRWNSNLCHYRYHQGTVRVHVTGYRPSSAVSTTHRKDFPFPQKEEF
jgi:hypothetical protein